jgi:S-formylglutathione hydrolase FrmB
MASMPGPAGPARAADACRRRSGVGERLIVGALFLACLLGLLGLAASSARAARIVTWKTTSRFVDPSTTLFGSLPSCVCVPHAPDHLPVNVYLPDGYDGARRFPVLYLLHGATDAYDTWLTRPATPYARGGDLRRLARGFPGIIVMPDGGAFGWYVNAWNGGRRGEPGWERYHLDELTALVERRLRVLPGRRHHAIAGWSMGGFGAAFYASQRPGYFGSVASLSGALLPARYNVVGASLARALGDPVEQRFYWAGHDMAVLAENLAWSRVLVAVGDGIAPPVDQQEDVGTTEGSTFIERSFGEQARDFAGRVRRAGATVRLEVVRGIHEQQTMRRELRTALGWFRRSFRQPLVERPRRWTFRTVAKFSAAFGFRFAFRSAPEDVTTFRCRGGRLTATGRGTVIVRTPAGHRVTLRLTSSGPAPGGPSMPRCGRPAGFTG